MPLKRAESEAKAWAALYRIILAEMRTHTVETEDLRYKAADIATAILTAPGIRATG